MSDISSRVDNYVQLKNYSFEELRTEGRSAHPQMTDIFPPDYMIDPSVLGSEFLDPCIPPKVDQIDLYEAYISKIQEKADELIRPSGRSAFEMKIDALNEYSRIEYEENLNKWSVTLDANIIYALIHKNTKGVEPDIKSKAPKYCTKHMVIKPEIVTIKNTTSYRKYVSLKDQLKVKQKENTSNWLSYTLADIYVGEYMDEDTKNNYDKILEENLIRSGEFSDDRLYNEPDTDFKVFFRLDKNRRNAIQAEMLEMAKPAFDLANEILKDCIKHESEIDWSYLKETKEKAEEIWDREKGLHPEGGGSIRA